MGLNLTRVLLWLSGETRVRTMGMCMAEMWRMKVATQMLMFVAFLSSRDLMYLNLQLFVTNLWTLV